MPGAHPADQRLTFGDFEVDFRSHQLSRAGVRVPLQQKALLVLRELTRRPHDVVTRAELIAALWPEGYYVDAEHGVNTAVRRLREALGDSAAEPRWIETLPRVGYRFLGDVQAVVAQPPALVADAPIPQASAAVRHAAAAESIPPTVAPARSGGGALGIAAAALLVVVVALLGARLVPAPAPAPKADDAVEELLARARYLRNVKRPADALRFVEQAAALAPGHPHVLAGLALGLLGQGRDDDARTLAARAVAADDRAWEAHRVLGLVALGAGDYRAGERHLRRAAAAGPADARSQTRLARHLLQTGRFDEARGFIAGARRFAPDDPDVQNLAMELALRSGDYAGAVREGERWLVIWAAQIQGQPTPIVRDMLGLAYVGAGRYDDALAQFRAIDPDDDLRVALVFAHAGRTAEARAILAAHEAAVARSPDDAGRDGAMAMAYAVLGDHPRALAYLERQRAAGSFPAWLQCRMFERVRGAAGYGDFARRLDAEYFSGAEVPKAPRRASPVIAAQVTQWPRPATRAGRS